MTTEIRKKREAIEKKIEKLENSILELQEKCPHTNASKKPSSSEFNYDKTLDRYWIEYHCRDCDKRWSIDIRY